MVQLSTLGNLRIMKGKPILRWLAILVAMPVGGVCGMLAADYLCRLSLGGGNAHGDVAAVLGSDVLGALIGALLVPFCVWYFTRQIRS